MREDDYGKERVEWFIMVDKKGLKDKGVWNRGEKVE
jgi:hypothetical protein